VRAARPVAVLPDATVPPVRAAALARPGRRAALLAAIVGASGFAGLGYELVWTRMLAHALGTEMMAVLGVVAGFFGGLALGAFVLDRPLARVRSPARAYAFLELVIGAWGVASVFLLPAVGRALPPLLGASPPPALLWLAGFAAPFVALLPATVAMGGTLNALERWIATATADQRVAAGVYGANTAGAVAGALVSAFALFGALGLSGTLLALAAVNGACAAGALLLGAPAAPADGARASPDRRLAVTLAATGLLGIAVEVLVVRLAAQALQNTLYTFAALLAAYLAGTAFGGLAWQRLGRGRTLPDVAAADRGRLLAAVSLACLVTALLAPYVLGPVRQAAPGDVRAEIAVALALFLLPAAAMGALFGQLAQEVRDRRGTLGVAVGINAAGAALAPLVAATALIPALGAWRALVAVGAAYLLLVPPRRRALAWAGAPAALAVALLVAPAPSFVRVPDGGRLLAVREGPMATASAVDDASGARYLEVNGHFRMGGTNSVRSDYRQAMLPLLLHPDPRRALFLGVGTGATLAGAGRMPGVDVRGVELSPEVVDLLPWFVDASSAPLPPVTNADARRFVAADRGAYDVIVADLFHPALDGSGSLYTVEHFRAVRERLAPGGVFCQWLPLYQLDLPSLKAIVRSFLAAYPDGSAWLGHLSVRMPMLGLVGTRDRGPLAVDALAARLAAPPVATVTAPVGLVRDLDVLGQFLAGPRALGAFAGEGPLNTDDRPFVALDATRNVRALAAPPAAVLLALVRGRAADAGELLAPADRAAWSGRLAAYWRARDAFLEAGAALPGDPRGAALVAAASPGLLTALRLSPEFDPAYRPLLAMAQGLLGSDRDAAERLLRAIAAAAPSRPEAAALLAREFGG
jgi:spermidine synthase